MTAQPIRVLILDDVPDDAELTILRLGDDGFEPDWERVDTEAAFLAALELQWDLILADYSMPTFTGLRALHLLRERNLDIPFILISGTIGEEVAVEAIKDGAYDYLLKGRLTRLGPAIRNALEEKRLRDENRAASTALLASERRFRALIENMAEGIALLSPEGAVIYESPAAKRTFGLEPLDMVGMNMFELLHPEDTPVATDLLAKLIEQDGGSVTATFRFRHADGFWRWIESTGTNLLEEPSVRAIVVNYRDVTERKLAEVEIKQRLAELEAVNRISTALRAARDLDDMLPLLVNTLVDALALDRGAIWLYDEKSNELYTSATANWTQAVREKPGEGVAGQVYSSGQAYVAADFSTDSKFAETFRTRSSEGIGGAYLPIRAAQEVIGVLSAGTRLPHSITPSELRLLGTVAEIAGSAIHRTRLHEQTEQRLQRITSLHTIDTAISSSFDLHFTLNLLLEQVASQLHVDAADILLLNHHTHTLEHVAGRGFRSAAGSYPQIRLGEGYAGRAALERRLVSNFNLAEGDKSFTRNDMALAEEFVTYFGVPLVSKGLVKGVLEVFHRQLFRPDPDWVDFLETLAGQAAIAIDDANLSTDLQRSNIELTLAYDATIEGWSHALDLRDRETEGHTLRVTEMTLSLAQAMGLGEADLVHIRRGALLHDIGKMGVPDSILLKPGSLTDDEWIIMRKHPTYAYEMLSPIDYLRPALEIPYCHHEKWDGTGYPRSLQGDKIPLSARIFAVVDVWDALRSDRPYREGWPEKKVLDYVRDQGGRHFDPPAVDMFMKLIRSDSANPAYKLRA